MNNFKVFVTTMYQIIHKGINNYIKVSHIRIANNFMFINVVFFMTASGTGLLGYSLFIRNCDPFHQIEQLF